MRATQLCRHLEIQEMRIDYDGYSVVSKDAQLKRAQGVDSQLHGPKQFKCVLVSLFCNQTSAMD